MGQGLLLGVGAVQAMVVVLGGWTLLLLATQAVVLSVAPTPGLRCCLSETMAGGRVR